MKRFAQLNGTLLSPLLTFTAAWIFAALLSQYRLLNGEVPWSAIVLVVVVAVPLAFVAGGLIGEGFALARARRAEASDVPKESKTYRRVLLVLLALGLLELVHQFAKIGGVPLLSPGGGALRFSQGGPTIILTDGLTVAAIVALVRPQRLLSRESRFELLVAAAALGGFALQAGRGSVVLPVFVAIAARWLYWGRPRNWMFIAGALLGFAAVVFGFYLRTRQNPYNPFESELFGEIIPDTPFFLQPLVPIYLAITTNFLALQGVVGHFPTGEAFGGGAFDAIGLDIVFHGARNLSDVSGTITPPWVTSTVAGPFWADGGFIVLIPGMAATGFISAGAFAMAVRTRTFRWSMIAAYLLYLAIFGLYTNLWTQSLDWLLVVPLLLIVGAIAEDPASPPGLTGRAWGRIRQMTGGTVAPSRPTTELESTEPSGKGDKKVGRGLVLVGVGVVAILLVSGLLIQPLLPEPYPLILSQRLPGGIASANAVMTNSDRPSDNEPLQWVRGNGHRLSLYSYTPGRPLSEAERVTRLEDSGGSRTLRLRRQRLAPMAGRGAVLLPAAAAKPLGHRHPDLELRRQTRAFSRAALRTPRGHDQGILDRQLGRRQTRPLRHHPRRPQLAATAADPLRRVGLPPSALRHPTALSRPLPEHLVNANRADSGAAEERPAAPLPGRTARPRADPP